MRQVDIHPGPLGGLTGRDILVALAIAAVVLVLTPVIGVLTLLLIG